MARNRSNNRSQGGLDFQALGVLAAAMGLAGGNQSTPASPPRAKMTERSVATLSVHEIGLFIQAIENDGSTDWSTDENDPGRRSSRVVVLDDVEAAKFRGRFQLVRSITPRSAPKLTPEQEELARVKRELADAQAALQAQTTVAASAE